MGPVKPNTAISADVSGFALAMGALTAKIAAPATGPQGKSADAAVPLPEGQDLADTGKELPDAVLGLEGKGEDQTAADSDKDEDASGEDAPPPSFAWFTIASTPVVQPEAKVEASATAGAEIGESAGKRARRDVQLPEVGAGEVTAPEAKAEAPAAKPVVPTSVAPTLVPDATPQSAVRRGDVQRQPKADAVAAAAAATAPADPAEVPIVEADAASTAATADTAGQTSTQPVLAQAPRELRKAAAEAPVVRITRDAPAPQQTLSIADLAPVQPQPAAATTTSQSVADQIFAAFDLPRQGTGATTAGDSQVDLSTLAAPATATQTIAAVAATGQGQDATLDTRDQQWAAKMIDKIEALRDASPVRETKLSLMPEGLGKVDIAIRQDDSGSLHVQFNTDTQAARQLIADAQPKLAEIAQERGIRLGSTSVESNATGTGAGSNTNSQMNQGQQNDARPQRNQPSAPPSARRETSTSTHDDERVA